MRSEDEVNHKINLVHVNNVKFNPMCVHCQLSVTQEMILNSVLGVKGGGDYLQRSMSLYWATVAQTAGFFPLCALPLSLSCAV